ncbi:hypothetical protein K466DRAFT_527889, partial [Polyporus arcularius HHB13444]
MGQQPSQLEPHSSEHVERGIAAISLEQEHRPLNVSMRGLANDILVDHIFPLLDVRDIINLRRASFQINCLSTEGIVWKRILKRAQHYLPPVPPTPKYSLCNLSAAEAERLLTRAVSLHDRYDRRIVRPLRRWEIDAGRTVLDMALLPGGQYLVASVADQSKTRFAIDLYTTDFAYRLGFPVARYDVPSRAFHLRAKYMTFRGRPGIAITYVRRDYRRPQFAERYGNINSFPPEWEDPRWRRVLMYECAAVYAPLDALEAVCEDVRPVCPVRLRVRTMPRPFQVLAEITSRSRMSGPVVEDNVRGAPLLAVLKRGPGGDCIVYKNLDGGAGTTMVCSPQPDYQGLPQSIMAFMILPPQNQFLVVRRASPAMDQDQLAQLQDLGPYYFSELYDIVHAPGTTFTRTAVSRSAVHDSRGNYWHNVWLSDPGFGPSPSPELERAPQVANMKPIVIFVSAKFSDGVAWDIVRPSSDSASGIYRYALSEDEAFVPIERLDSAIEDLAALFEHRVLLGSTRPLVCNISRHGRRAGSGHSFRISVIRGLRDRCLLRYEDESVSMEVDDGEAETESDAQSQGDDGECEPAGDVKVAHFELANEDLREVSAIAWDETIGRLCVSYSRHTRIAVFDFA